MPGGADVLGWARDVWAEVSCSCAAAGLDRVVGLIAAAVHAEDCDSSVIYLILAQSLQPCVHILEDSLAG